MSGLLARAAFGGGAVLLGWVSAAAFPPPVAITERINPGVVRQISERGMVLAAETGRMIAVERVSVEMEDFAVLPDWGGTELSGSLGLDGAAVAGAVPGAPAGSPEAAVTAVAAGPAPAPTAAPASKAAAPAPARAPAVQRASADAKGPEGGLALCPGMRVSNAPPADARRVLLGYTPDVEINGVSIDVNPTRGQVCLSSGFGPRGGRVHRGLDYHSRTGATIHAAADGTVIEMKWRDDYGNMLLIDHGNGVYTRYAHLAGFQSGVAVGGRVRKGDQLGLMGNTAAYPLPVHLHYEVLLGDYDNPKASFGLRAVSPFAQRSTVAE